MKNTKLVAYFYDNLIDWFGQTNGTDCETFDLTKQSGYPIDSYKKKFELESNEIILFARDTSSWNNCNQGLVLTNIGIYHIENNKIPGNRQFIPWTDIDNVRYIKRSLVFRFKLKDGAKIPDISFYDFFKSIDEKKLSEIGPQLAIDIVRLASLASTKEKKAKTIPKTRKRNTSFCDGVISSSSFSEAEQQYLKHYYEYIKKQGAICDSERNKLEQLRISLGLSKTSALEAAHDLERALSSKKMAKASK